MEELFWKVVAGVEIVLLFAIVVMIHEFGHFVFAKLFGVKVESFNIGFGRKRLVSIRLGETDYTIRPWPLGGFVQLHGHFRPEEIEALEGGGKKDEGADAGECDKPADETGTTRKASVSEMAYDDVRALREKPYYVKLFVFGAGVVFNFLSVGVVLAVISMLGRPGSPSRLDVVPEDSPLHKAGLRSLDRIHRVGGEEVASWSALEARLGKIRKSPDRGPVEFVVVRDDTTTVTVAVPAAVAAPEVFDEIGPWAAAKVGTLFKGKPAHDAGLQLGDVIEAIDGEETPSWGAMTKLIRARPEQETELRIRRTTETIVVKITPEKQQGEGYGVIGVGISTEGWPIVYTLNPVAALTEGVTEAALRMWDQTKALAAIFAGGSLKTIRDSVAGPVGIVTIGYEQAKKGFGHLIHFFCLLSLALVIFNILPIPLLDGGHILQATIESVTRRPIPMRVLIVVYNAALVFLLAFVVFVTANDLMRMRKGSSGETPPAQTTRDDGVTSGALEGATPAPKTP